MKSCLKCGQPVPDDRMYCVDCAEKRTETLNKKPEVKREKVVEEIPGHERTSFSSWISIICVIVFAIILFKACTSMESHDPIPGDWDANGKVDMDDTKTYFEYKQEQQDDDY